MASILAAGALGAAATPPGDRDAAPPAVWGFRDVARQAGLDFVQRSGTPRQEYIVEVKSTGVALLDLDGDGLLDIFLAAGSTIERHFSGKPGYGCRLYRNLGGLRFADATAAAGLPPLGWACGAAAADVDDDGDDDLLVTLYGCDRLFLNRGGVFAEASPLPGAGAAGWSTSAAFGDLDGDGDLDLYTAGYLDFDCGNPPRHGPTRACLWKGMPVVCGPRGLPPRADQVLENLGGGRFRDATRAWGFASVAPRYGLGVLIADLTGDARPEVFVANDSTPNFLFTSGSGGFREIGFISGVALDENGRPQAGMGVDAFDIDSDGDLDLAVTNFEQEENNLYVNQGEGIFFDRSDALGVGPPGHLALGWGVGAEDFNNDGLLDLFVANGHVYPQAATVEGTAGYAQRDHLFLAERNGGRLRLVERGARHGLTARHVSRAAAFGDLDNDGDVDIVVCHLNERPALYENRAPAGNRSLSIRLRQPPPNREAIGARVTVRAGPIVRTDEVRRQSSFQASSDPRIHIGLGASAPAGEALVRWPDGTRERFAIPTGGGALLLERGHGKP